MRGKGVGGGPAPDSKDSRSYGGEAHNRVRGGTTSNFWRRIKRTLVWRAYRPEGNPQKSVRY